MHLISEIHCKHRKGHSIGLEREGKRASVSSSHVQALEPTTRMNRSRHLRDLLRHNHSKTPDTSRLVNIPTIDGKNDGSKRVDSLFQVPVDVAVKEPRARVVRHEPDCNA